MFGDLCPLLTGKGVIELWTYLVPTFGQSVGRQLTK